MNITELKALAEKATPGPWKSRIGFHNGTVEIFAPDKDIKPPFYPTELASVEVEGKQGKANAAFIKAANPAAILELIAAHEDAQGEIRALRERVKALEEGLKKIKRGIDDELDQDWTCNSYHPNLIKAEVIARALLEQKP